MASEGRTGHMTDLMAGARGNGFAEPAFAALGAPQVGEIAAWATPTPGGLCKSIIRWWLSYGVCKDCDSEGVSWTAQKRTEDSLDIDWVVFEVVFTTYFSMARKDSGLREWTRMASRYSCTISRRMARVGSSSCWLWP